MAGLLFGLRTRIVWWQDQRVSPTLGVVVFPLCGSLRRRDRGGPGGDAHLATALKGSTVDHLPLPRLEACPMAKIVGIM